MSLNFERRKLQLIGKSENKIFSNKNDPTWYASLRGASGTVNVIICTTVEKINLFSELSLKKTHFTTNK